jgi:hypothetical protein
MGIPRRAGTVPSVLPGGLVPSQWELGIPRGVLRNQRYACFNDDRKGVERRLEQQGPVLEEADNVRTLSPN